MGFHSDSEGLGGESVKLEKIDQLDTLLGKKTHRLLTGKSGVGTNILSVQ